MLLGWLTGGTLDRVLRTVDNAVDNDTRREEIKARTVEKFVQTEAETRQAMMQSRTFWAVWALFAAPLGTWWALVMFDTAFTFVSWGIPDLPSSVRPWADTIFGSIFGSGAAVGIAQIVAGAVRRR